MSIFLITTGSSRQLLPALLYLLHPCSRIQAMTLTAPPHSLQVSMHKDVPLPRRTGSPRAADIDVEHTFQALCPLVRMSRCRGAHGCAGATKLLPGMACMPVLQEQKPVIDTRRSAGVCSDACSGVWAFLPLPRRAGVTLARYLLWGANTPL